MRVLALIAVGLVALAIVLVALAIAGVALTEVTGNAVSVSPTSTPLSNEAAALALLPSGDRQRYERDLGLLTSSCQEARDHLAGMPVVTHEEMLKRGVDEGYLSIMDAVTGIVTKETAQEPALSPLRCADEFAAYATLRTHGSGP